MKTIYLTLLLVSKDETPSVQVFIVIIGAQITLFRQKEKKKRKGNAKRLKIIKTKPVLSVILRLLISFDFYEYF